MQINCRTDYRARIAPCAALTSICSVSFTNQDPTFALAHAVAAAVVRDADDRPALFEAASAIASGNERSAARFGYALAVA